MPKSGLSGSVRGVPSNGHPYRDPGSRAAVPSTSLPRRVHPRVSGLTDGGPWLRPWAMTRTVRSLRPILAACPSTTRRVPNGSLSTCWPEGPNCGSASPLPTARFRTCNPRRRRTSA